MRHSSQAIAGLHRQTGAVLIVSMIFLIVLTLLAVSSMNTTSLEEKMASNQQESINAFQAAETGLAQALADLNSYDLTGTYSVAPADVGDNDQLATEYETDFLGVSAPPLVLNDPELLNSISCFETANFDLISTGSTNSGVAVTVHGGAWQLKKIPGKC
mgnify:CR=1 FL=1